MIHGQHHSPSGIAGKLNLLRSNFGIGLLLNGFLTVGVAVKFDATSAIGVIGKSIGVDCGVFSFAGRLIFDI